MPLIAADDRDDFPRSEMPPGGSPADDRAYRVWRNTFLSAADELRRARAWHASAEVEPVEPYQLDRHLFAVINGNLPLWGGRDGVLSNHMLRTLAIAFRRRPRDLARFAQSYIDRIDGDRRRWP